MQVERVGTGVEVAGERQIANVAQLRIGQLEDALGIVYVQVETEVHGVGLHLWQAQPFGKYRMVAAQMTDEGFVQRYGVETPLEDGIGHVGLEAELAYAVAHVARPQVERVEGPGAFLAVCDLEVAQQGRARSPFRVDAAHVHADTSFEHDVVVGEAQVQQVELAHVGAEVEHRHFFGEIDLAVEVEVDVIVLHDEAPVEQGTVERAVDGDVFVAIALVAEAVHYGFEVGLGRSAGEAAALVHARAEGDLAQVGVAAEAPQVEGGEVEAARVAGAFASFAHLQLHVHARPADAGAQVAISHEVVEEAVELAGEVQAPQVVEVGRQVEAGDELAQGGHAGVQMVEAQHEELLARHGQIARVEVAREGGGAGEL